MNQSLKFKLFFFNFSSKNKQIRQFNNIFKSSKFIILLYSYTNYSYTNNCISKNISNNKKNM